MPRKPGGRCAQVAHHEGDLQSLGAQVCPTEQSEGSKDAGWIRREHAVHRRGRNPRRGLLDHNELSPWHVAPDFELPLPEARIQSEGGNLFAGLINVQVFHHPFRPDLPVFWTNGGQEVRSDVLQTGTGPTAVEDSKVHAIATAKARFRHGYTRAVTMLRRAGRLTF